jgi:hypothetical protein
MQLLIVKPGGIYNYHSILTVTVVNRSWPSVIQFEKLHIDSSRRLDLVTEKALLGNPPISLLRLLDESRARHCSVAIPCGSRHPIAPVIVMDDNEMAAPCNRHLLTLRSLHLLSMLGKLVYHTCLQ